MVSPASHIPQGHKQCLSLKFVQYRPMTVAKAFEWKVRHHQHGWTWVHDKDSVSSWTWRWFPPITDRQLQLTPLGGRIGVLPSSPLSTTTTLFSISDSDRRFCLIVVGTITLVSSFSCLRNFFLERLLRWCLAFCVQGMVQAWVGHFVSSITLP